MFSICVDFGSCHIPHQKLAGKCVILEKCPTYIQLKHHSENATESRLKFLHKIRCTDSESGIFNETIMVCCPVNGANYK